MNKHAEKIELEDNMLFSELGTPIIELKEQISSTWRHL
jgi:hypothetical protein